MFVSPLSAFFINFCVVLHFAVSTVSEDSNMATRMRITVLTSILLVLLSPKSVSSAQLPVPVACFERCPITDADCIDACRAEAKIESETDGDLPVGEKRASAFVRIGRPAGAALDKRASSFIRIGRNEPGVDVPASAATDKRKDAFVRIGRASAFVRIGRRGLDDGADNPKRTSSFVRIGKSSSRRQQPSAADSAVEVDSTGNKRSSSFVRIGRSRHAPPPEIDERWLPVGPGVPGSW